MEPIKRQTKIYLPIRFVSPSIFTFSHENRIRLGHGTDQTSNENLHTHSSLYLHHFFTFMSWKWDKISTWVSAKPIKC